MNCKRGIIFSNDIDTKRLKKRKDLESQKEEEYRE